MGSKYAAPMSWRSALPELLAEQHFRTQAEIVDALQRRGEMVDQSTVSRELRSLGVRKRQGVYRLPESVETRGPVHSLAMSHGGGVAVLRTEPAFASVIAQTIDDAALPGVLGTIAGDDTVFVALADPAVATHLRRLAGLPARRA